MSLGVTDRRRIGVAPFSSHFTFTGGPFLPPSSSQTTNNNSPFTDSATTFGSISPQQYDIPERADIDINPLHLPLVTWIPDYPSFPLLHLSHPPRHQRDKHILRPRLESLDIPPMNLSRSRRSTIMRPLSTPRSPTEVPPSSAPKPFIDCTSPGPWPGH
jgi:hypothetical protein